METQLTALERKIDLLLATVEPGPETDKLDTETKSNVIVAGEDHSQSK